MPALKISNPLKSLDLTAFDVRKLDVRKLSTDVRDRAEDITQDIVRHLPIEQARKAVAPAAKIARDAAYVAVGFGVIATQRVNARRYDLRERVEGVQQRISEVAPRVRDEAQATAQRVIDEASQKVRELVERRKHVANTENTVA
ncbi:MAG: hypothetical protein RL072_444 [Actinomycetota bacterium]|jgi:hypothetical protein